VNVKIVDTARKDGTGIGMVKNIRMLEDRMTGQLSLFDYIKVSEMYDGYIVKVTKTIECQGCRQKLTEGEIYYLVTRHKRSGLVSIAFPNNYGGSFGFCVTKNQFQSCFESTGKKIYPKSNEIWDGTAWIKNPVQN
jgi:hypothetical protein